MKIQEPAIPECEEWTDLARLKMERDVVGFFISGHPLDKFKFELQHISTKGGLALLENIDTMNGKRFQLGGMISNAEHRISQAGSPWGQFTLEDYDGSYEFRLFRDDYLAYKNFMNDEWMVLVSGVVSKRPSWGNNPVDRGCEFKIKKIEMLSDVKDKRLEKVVIDLNLNALDRKWVDNLESAISASKGKVGMVINVFDGKNKLEMPSRNTHVGVSNEFLEKLESICIPGVANYKFELKKG